MLLQRTISQNASHLDEPGLDLTPIIDMVFMLLIFFLVATTFQKLEREAKIALPQTIASEPISTAMREIVINVDADGQIRVAGKALSEEQLTSMLKTAVAANPQQKVSIRGDRTTAYANVARALDVCKQCGVTEPFLQSIPLR